MQNLPFDLNSQKVQRAITNVIKRSFQRKVEFQWHRFKNKGSGKLTFPTLEIGQQFLNANRNGFKLRGRNGEYRTVRVSLSRNPPDARLVEGLQKRIEERQLLQSDSEDDYSGPDTMLVSQRRTKCRTTIPSPSVGCLDVGWNIRSLWNHRTWRTHHL